MRKENESAAKAVGEQAETSAVDEGAISEKMAAGLSREQAQEVVNRQKEEDKNSSK